MLSVSLDALADVQQYEEHPRLVTQAVRRAKLLRCALRGVNAKDAARVVGCSHATAMTVYSDPSFQRRVHEQLEGVFEGVDAGFIDRQMSLHERIEQKAKDAFKVLADMLDNNATPPHLRAKVAMDMLDRNPETQAGHSVTTRRDDELAETLRAAAAASREADNVVTMRRKGA
jgi:hypothetical protein